MNLIDHLKPLIGTIKVIITKRWFRLALQILILVFCVVYLIKNLQSIKTAQVEFDVNLYILTLSCGLTIIAVFLGAVGYHLTLKALALTINWKEAIDIHLQSNLAKYIPGYAWQLIGKAYLTQKAGVSIRLVGLAMTIELIQLLLAGICVVFLSFPIEIAFSWKIDWIVNGILPIIRYIPVVIFLLFPFLITWILSKTKFGKETVHANPIVLLGASLVMFTSWIIFGYSFWLIGRAFFPITIEQLSLFIFTLTTSILIGLAFVIMPGSIGIRESIMVWILGPIIGSPQAVIIAAMARIIVTISELFSAFTFHLFKQRFNNPKVLEPQSNSERLD